MVVIFIDRSTDNGFGYAPQHTERQQQQQQPLEQQQHQQYQQQQPQYDEPLQPGAYGYHYQHQAAPYGSPTSAYAPRYSHGGHGGHHRGHHHHGHHHGQGNRYLLAERYKTKTCRNYMLTGACPYQHRCMVAHGQHELRTTDMNIRDGLLTEEAIRSFQRAMTAYNRGELAQMQEAQMLHHQHQQLHHPHAAHPGHLGCSCGASEASDAARSSVSPTEESVDGSGSSTSGNGSMAAPSTAAAAVTSSEQAACNCSDCHAARATHNPYYAAVPSASALGQAMLPYSGLSAPAQC